MAFYSTYQTSPLTLVTLGLMAGEAASVVAIILDPEIMVYVMAGITMLNGLLSCFKEYHIMKNSCEYINNDTPFFC